MFNVRKVMSTACISTRGSEARCVNGFTAFIVPPVGERETLGRGIGGV